MKNSRYVLFLLLAVMVIYSKAQNEKREIHGTVYEFDKNGIEIPIPGVNIYWAGTQSGTTTDTNGYFTLGIFDLTAPKLVVSFVGYKNDTISINHQEHLKITLSADRELEEVVVAKRAPGAHISRVEPIVTQKITGAELQKAACCNLAESFETNASVDVSYADAVSGAKQIQLLGLAGTYSQLMIENIPNIRGLASSFGLGYIPGSWMESIQVSKGAASVKNGYESITGQVNTEYKKPDNSEFLFVNLYGNSYGKIEGNAYSAVKLSEQLSTMVLTHAEQFDAKIDRNDDSFLDQPKVKQINVFNRWKYDGKHIHAQFGVKLLGEERKGGQLHFDESQPVDNNNGYGINIDTKRYEVFTKTAYLFDRPKTNIGFINTFIHHRQHSFFGLNKYDAKEDNYYGNLMFQSYIGTTDHTFTTGISYLADHYNETLNDSLFTRKESVPGLFLEYTYINAEKLSLILGLRTDFHNLYGTLITPRIHFKYNLSRQTIFRASAGKGYRTPNVFAENISLLASSKTIVVSEALKMEEAWNYGINLTKYLTVGGKEMSVNAEFYRTDFLNQAIIDRDQSISSIYIYNLTGKSYSNSFQLEVNYELLKNFDFNAAFRYTDVKMTINNELKRKPLVNKYKGLINLSYATNLKKWQFDLTAQFNGDKRLPETSQNPVAYQLADKSPAYTILNAQVTRYFRKWNVYIGGENLTNFKQKNPIVAPDDPFGPYFDASMIWGPITGIKMYAGLRFNID